MRKENFTSNISLEALAGGAFAEKFNEALMQVAENIQNPNTDPTAKRGITVNIKFTPNKTRQMVNTSIAVTTKLAATEAIDTQMVMGVNMRNGKIEIAEYDGQVLGQMAIQDLAQPDGEPTKAEPQSQAPGKPLNLKDRNKSQENNTPEMIAGRDYDPDTGEVYENPGNVVFFNDKAAQA